MTHTDSDPRTTEEIWYQVHQLNRAVYRSRTARETARYVRECAQYSDAKHAERIVAAREAGEVKALMRAEDDAHHAKRHYEWMVKHYDKMARDAAEVMRRVRAGEDMKIPPLGGTTTHLHFD